MPAYYTYLISSLPGLNFSAKAPFGLQDFLARCEHLIPKQEFDILCQVLSQEAPAWELARPESLQQWRRFEITLRNELARARSSRRKIDPAKYLRQPDQAEAQISHLALLAYRSSSILEAEKILDQARWSFLEDLSLGHYFDFDYLFIYGLKLKLLERWDKIEKADKEFLLNAAV